MVIHGPTGTRFKVDVNPAYEAYVDDIKKQIAAERGWNPEDIEVEHYEPPPANPVTFACIAINTDTGERIHIEFTTMSQDATSAHEKARMRFTEEVKRQIAEYHEWDVADTEIEYDKLLLDQ